MNIINPFQVADFRTFGDYYFIIFFTTIFIFYFVCSLGKFTNRRMLYISIYMCDIFLGCIISAIFYWYFAIIIFIIVWFAVVKLYKVELRIVINDEASGVTASNNWKIEKQKEKWNKMLNFEKQKYIDNYNNSMPKPLNLIPVFILSFLIPVLLIIVLNLVGFHYHFF